MKLTTKHFIKTLIIVLLLFSTTSFATEINNTNENSSETNELNIYAQSCILVECSTHRIAYEKNAETRLYPASTTKVLTAILAVEKCNLTDTVTITNDMISRIPPGYTTAYLQVGETVTVEELLNTLLIPSANDSGFALAIHISGSIEDFANLMNEKAKEIGCQNSNFTNPSGIHDEKHYSTAKDMALIGQYAMNYPQITDIVCKTSYTLHPGASNARTFETTNTLIKPSEKNYYEFANGFKTGFTDPAGACIIATAQKDNMKFLAVVLNAPESDSNINYRDADCKTLFEYGFTNFDKITKVDEKVIEFLNKAYTSSIPISTVLKFCVALFGLYLVFALLKSHKKNSVKCKS